MTNEEYNDVGLESIVTVYSNTVSIVASAYDFRLTFGLMLGHQDGVAQRKMFAQIYITPVHAKALAALLSRQIEVYEARYGTLPSQD